MSFSEKKRESIKRYMLEKIRMDDEKFIAKTAENFEISTTSVKRYIADYMSNKVLEEDENSKTGYCLVTLERDFSYERDESLMEDKIYYSDIRPFLDELSSEAKNIWSYAFMEMMNNAIEHSCAEKICCHIRKDYLYTEISIMDDGIGIFKKIREYLKERFGREADNQDVLAELYKGKFTTDQEAHSGGGIFFTSKMMSEFAIWSDDAVFSVGSNEKETFVRSHLIAYYTRIKRIGTIVIMKLENQTSRKSQEVFDMYAPVEEGFVKTYIPLKEICPYGEPIARSQARRILYRLEQFRQVEFDFAGIEFLGQGFADEVFRVFQNKYPDIKLLPLNANESVAGMIRHVRAGVKHRKEEVY